MNVNRYKKAISAARSAVDDMDLDNTLQPIAFTEVLRVALNESKTESRGSESLGVDRADHETQGGIQRIAEHLNIPEDAANAVFDLSTGKPCLGIPSHQLPAAKRTATQEIALVLCAAYEALGLDPPDTDIVRQECENYSRYDSANFAKSLGAMDGRLTPKGQPRAKRKTLIISVPGREEAARVIQRWTGEDDSS